MVVAVTVTAGDGVGEATNSVVAVLDITAAMTGRWSFGGRRAESGVEFDEDVCL